MISPTLDPWSVTNLRSVIEARAAGKVTPDWPLVPAFFSFDEGNQVAPSPGVCDACGEPIGPFGCPGCR